MSDYYPAGTNASTFDTPDSLGLVEICRKVWCKNERCKHFEEEFWNTFEADQFQNSLVGSWTCSTCNFTNEYDEEDWAE